MQYNCSIRQGTTGYNKVSIYDVSRAGKLVLEPASWIVEDYQ